MEREKKAKKLEKKKRSDDPRSDDLRQKTRTALENLEQFLATKPFPEPSNEVEVTVRTPGEDEHTAPEGSDADCSKPEPSLSSGKKNEPHIETPPTASVDVEDVGPAELRVGISGDSDTISKWDIDDSIHLDAEHDATPSGACETGSGGNTLGSTSKTETCPPSTNEQEPSPAIGWMLKMRLLLSFRWLCPEIRISFQNWTLRTRFIWNPNMTSCLRGREPRWCSRDPSICVTCRNVFAIQGREGAMR